MLGCASFVDPGYPGAQITSVTGEGALATAQAAARRIARRIEVLFDMAAPHYAWTPGSSSSRGARFARVIVDRAWLILAFWLLCAPPAVYYALSVRSDNSPDRLIVEGDEDYKQTRAFQKIFPEGQYVVLLAEAGDPFAPEALARVAALENALRAVPKVKPLSALTIYRQTHPDFTASKADAAAFQAFATGTTLFKKQGLVGEGVLGIPMELQVGSRDELQGVLAAVDKAVAPFQAAPAPLSAVRKIGGPYVDRYLSEETQRSTLLYMPLFGLFIVLLNLFLYRSFRTLFAFLLTIGLTVLFTQAFAGLMGFVSTIVSSLVPLTVLITCTATLVYLHSLFVDCPAGADIREHQVFALCNKFLALHGVDLRRRGGLRRAGGVRRSGRSARWGSGSPSGMVVHVDHVVHALPGAADACCARRPQQERRHGRRVVRPRIASCAARVLLPLALVAVVPASLVLCASASVALLGVPGVRRADAPARPTRSSTSTTTSPLYKDTRRFEATMSGLSVTEVWIQACRTAASSTRACCAACTASSDSAGGATRASARSSACRRPSCIAALRAGAGGRAAGGRRPRGASSPATSSSWSSTRAGCSQGFDRQSQHARERTRPRDHARPGSTGYAGAQELPVGRVGRGGSATTRRSPSSP